MQRLLALGGLLPVASTAAQAPRCRRRRSVLILAALALAPSPGAAGAAPSCNAPGTGWCVARRFPGSVPKGELGFRFGEPLDVDGDRRADPAAGSRWALQQKTLQNGSAFVWSGASGATIRAWDGEWADGLFGHWVLPIPDVSGDGLADVVIAAPQAPGDGPMQGIVVARSPKTGRELWRYTEAQDQNLGWDMALAGDQNGDGRIDLFVGAPSDHGRVHLVSGRNGRSLRTYVPAGDPTTFGWFVAQTDDLDGDRRADLAVGAPSAKNAAGEMVGAAWIFSTANGRELRHWIGTDTRGGFGGVVAAVADLDGDGKSELAVAAPGTEDQTRTLTGELRIYSGVSGQELRHWEGTQPGELYGRMIVAAGDLDGDGIGDLAVSAPWYRRDGADRVGRVELRSGRTGAVLAELVGDEADCWFGWHIRRAPDPDGHGRPTLLIGSLRCPVDGNVGVGVLDLWVLRDAKEPAQGTTRRDARRSDIR